MKITAVIFDLFGTLVDNMSMEDHRAILTSVAELLSAPAGDFIQEWNGSFRERATGQLASTRAAIQHVCEILGVTPDEVSLNEACRLRTEYTKRILNPRSDALPTLTSLRERGFKICLITDCTAEVPPLWKKSAFAPLFDTVIFSCALGMKKPDPRIYRIACSELDVAPGDVLYVGDGSSHELDGAQAVGMTPVLIDVDHERGKDVFKIDEQPWDGRTVQSLAEIPRLINSMNK